MRFHTRKWVKPEDLNPNGTLFGGRLLAWVDEEAALYTVVQLDNPQIVTKFGTASITLRVEVRNMMTKKTIITIEKIVMVNLNSDGKPTPHGKTKIEYIKDRLK